MTDEQRYIELLKAISELLFAKKTKIAMLEYEVQRLGAVVAKAEKTAEAGQ